MALAGDVLDLVLQFLRVSTADVCNARRVCQDLRRRVDDHLRQPALWFQEWVANDGLGGMRFECCQVTPAGGPPEGPEGGPEPPTPLAERVRRFAAEAAQLYARLPRPTPTVGGSGGDGNGDDMDRLLLTAVGVPCQQPLRRLQRRVGFRSVGRILGWLRHSGWAAECFELAGGAAALRFLVFCTTPAGVHCLQVRRPPVAGVT
eukprot:EG_transcript_28214